MKTPKVVLILVISVVLTVLALRFVQDVKMSQYAIHGVDVSHYQQEVDWNEVNEEYQFVFLKATEGAGLKDKFFRKHWQKLHTMHLKRGAYHFFMPAVDAKQQARHFISQVQLKPGDLPPVLDVEITQNVPSREMVKGVRTWLQLIEGQYRVRPILYTNYAFYNQHLRQHLGDYPVWIAYYSLKTPQTSPNWHFWQYSDQGRIRGIEGKVDLNVFNGSLEDLNRLCVP